MKKKWFRTRFESCAGVLKFVNEHGLGPGEFQVLNDSDLTYYELVYCADRELENKYKEEPDPEEWG